MVMLIQVAAAFMAIAAFSVAMEVPKEYLPYCGCIGAAGWFVYLIVLQLMGMIAANVFATAIFCSTPWKRQRTSSRMRSTRP